MKERTTRTCSSSTRILTTFNEGGRKKARFSSAMQRPFIPAIFSFFVDVNNVTDT